jgi:hypothetical protein
MDMLSIYFPDGWNPLFTCKLFCGLLAAMKRGSSATRQSLKMTVLGSLVILAAASMSASASGDGRNAHTAFADLRTRLDLPEILFVNTQAIVYVFTLRVNIYFACPFCR